jgi:hypothetical protein
MNLKQNSVDGLNLAHDHSLPGLVTHDAKQAARPGWWLRCDGDDDVSTRDSWESHRARFWGGVLTEATTQW